MIGGRHLSEGHSTAIVISGQTKGAQRWHRTSLAQSGIRRTVSRDEQPLQQHTGTQDTVLLLLPLLLL